VPKPELVASNLATEVVPLPLLPEIPCCQIADGRAGQRPLDGAFCQHTGANVKWPAEMPVLAWFPVVQSASVFQAQ